MSTDGAGAELYTGSLTTALPAGDAISWQWAPFVSIFLGLLLLLAISFSRHVKARRKLHPYTPDDSRPTSFHLAIVNPVDTLASLASNKAICRRPTHGYRTVAEARRHGLSCRFSMFYVRPNVNEILRDAFAEMFQSPFYVDQICSDYSAGGDSADSCDCDPGRDSADSCDCDPGRDCADSCDCDQVRSFTPVSEDIK